MAEQTYLDLLEQYKKYNKKATRTAQGLQAALAIGEVFSGREIKKNLRYESPERMKASLVDLKTANILEPAMRRLNRSFISSVNAQREAGRVVDSSLLATYGDQALQAEQAQAMLTTQIRNQEATLNQQAISQADQVNAQIGVKESESRMQISVAKAAQDAKTYESIKEGIANIGNIGARSVANELSAALRLKPLHDAEILAEKKKQEKIKKAEKAQEDLINKDLDAGMDKVVKSITDSDTSLFHLEHQYKKDWDLEDEDFIPDLPAGMNTEQQEFENADEEYIYDMEFNTVDVFKALKERDFKKWEKDFLNKQNELTEEEKKAAAKQKWLQMGGKQGMYNYSIR